MGLFVLVYRDRSALDNDAIHRRRRIWTKAAYILPSQSGCNRPDKRET